MDRPFRTIGSKTGYLKFYMGKRMDSDILCASKDCGGRDAALKAKKSVRECACSSHATPTLTLTFRQREACRKQGMFYSTMIFLIC